MDWEYWELKKIWARGVQAGVSGLITEGILYPAAFAVANTVRAMPLNTDAGVGLENGFCTLKHFIMEEILVDVGIELQRSS